MNIFYRLTLRSMMKNKTRTVVTIIGIIISAAMICAVTTFAASLQNFAVENAVYQNGDWHGKTTRSYLDTIANSDEVNNYFLSGGMGYAKAEGCLNEFKPYIYIMTADGDYLSNMPIHLISGRLPNNPNEIIIPEHLIYNGGLHYSVGDTLCLDIGKRMYENDRLFQSDPCYIYNSDGYEVLIDEELVIEKSAEYTVVGIYARPTFENISAPGYTAITYCDREDIINSDNPIEVYYKMKNPLRFYSFKNENNIWGSNNTSVLNYLGSFRYSSFTAVLTGCVVIVILLIMFGSVSLIYNSFAISVSERTRDFGLLSSIGATKRQMKRMVLFEALTVAMVGIPFGILSGIGGIAVTLMIIGNKFATISGFTIPMRVCVSPVSVVIAIIVAIVTVLISAVIPSMRVSRSSAIESIRMSYDIKNSKWDKTSRLTIKLFKAPGLLASKYYKRSRKKYLTTVFSLFMSIVLFVGASSFTGYLTESVNKIKNRVGYDVIFYCNSADFRSNTPMGLLEQMKNGDGVEDGAYTLFKFIYPYIPSEQLGEGADEYLISRLTGTLECSTELVFVDNDSFRQLLSQYKLNEEDYFNSQKPLAVAVDGNTFFHEEDEKYVSPRLLKEEPSTLSFEEIKMFDDYYIKEHIYDENGYITHYVYRNMKTGDTMTLTAKEALESRDYSYGKVIYHRPFYIDSASADFTFIYPEWAMEKLLGKEAPDSYNYYFTAKEHAKACKSLKVIASENGMEAQRVVDCRKSNEENRNIVTIVKVFSYGFITLISLIAAANVFNTLSTNITLRRREFAVLKSVGMTSRDFNKIMCYECLLYGTRALLLGLPVSVVISYLIHHVFSSGYVTAFRLPLSAMTVASLSVFLVVFVTMLYSMSKIKKTNTIDILKNENI